MRLASEAGSLRSACMGTTFSAFCTPGGMAGATMSVMTSRYSGCLARRAAVRRWPMKPAAPVMSIVLLSVAIVIRVSGDSSYS